MHKTRIVKTQDPRQQLQLITAEQTMPLFTGTPQTAAAEKWNPRPITHATQDAISPEDYSPVTGPPPPADDQPETLFNHKEK